MKASETDGLTSNIPVLFSMFFCFVFVFCCFFFVCVCVYVCVCVGMTKYSSVYALINSSCLLCEINDAFAFVLHVYVCQYFPTWNSPHNTKHGKEQLSLFPPSYENDRLWMAHTLLLILASFDSTPLALALSLMMLKATNGLICGKAQLWWQCF